MRASTRALQPDDLDFLAAVPLFHNIGRQQLQDLVGQGNIYEFGQKAQLFSAGDPADCFYAVRHGAVHLQVLTEDGSEGVVRIIGEGETFAEAAMFGAGRFPLNSEAQADTVLIRIEKSRFLAMIQAQPEILAEMFSDLVARQTFMIEEIRRQRTQSPMQRLAAYLLTLYEVTDWKGRGQLPLPKQLIAGRIGVDPATLSRVLRRLEPAGITCHNNDVRVKDIEGLRRFCEQSGGQGTFSSL